jgi:prepilin-type N-terminal cleavage/methylation domain-containing protein/prepilin-type processing-associated H-X9-DG protein
MAYSGTPRHPQTYLGSPRAFTLIELLVVTAIISLLIAILLPGLALARSQARRTVCTSNLRNIGLGVQIYALEYKSYPPAWINGTCRWMDLIKPYIAKSSGVYQCPEDPVKQAVTWDSTIILSYGINTFNFNGNKSCFWYGVKALAVNRPSQTIIFADCTPGKYYCGGGNSFSNPVVDVDYRHVGKSFAAVFCDGHAEPKTTTTQQDWDASQ